jgi:hypothetical protein
MLQPGFAFLRSNACMDACMHAGAPPDVAALTPWFTEYRDEFARLLQFGDHETVDHPIGGEGRETVDHSIGGEGEGLGAGWSW